MMNADGSTLKSSFSATSAVRPRNRRLISYNDESESEQPLDVTSTSSQLRIDSTSSSRNVSPVPRTHLPRPETSSRSANNWLNGDTSRESTRTSTNPRTSGLWETSWSSLQGLASSLLGSNATLAGDNHVRSRSPLGASPWLKTTKSVLGSSSSSAEWGPPNNTSLIAAGSQEEHRALVQAKKREALMRADLDQTIDARGNHKRRDSDSRTASYGQPPDVGEDALVYIHHVKPGDTMAGVTIKYGCDPAAFRKVNRFWPNDNIQIRKVVMLPVDACTTRGRRIEQNLLDLVEDDNTEQSEVTPTADSATKADPFSTSAQTSNDPNQEDRPWKHEYFVKIDGIPESVEIGRVSRRDLGFFPPSRRKSITFSELDPVDSRNTSLDLSRQTSQLDSSSQVNSPSRNALPHRIGRHRSSSASQNPYLARLRGPGGVGNLSGRSAVMPGPAPDSLNKLFASHLPSVEPPDSLSFLVEDDDLDVMGSQTSRASSLENFGGAIEGWIRRMGTKVSAAANQNSGKFNGYSNNGRSNANAVMGWIPSGMGGDLIELGETPLEFGGDDGILGSQTGPATSQTSASGFAPSAGFMTLGKGTVKAGVEQDQLLRSRKSGISEAVARKKDD